MTASLARDLIAHTARAYPDKPAFVDARRQATWREMDRRSTYLAGALQQLGVGVGDVVALLGTDHVELYEHWFACLKIGAVRTAINYRYGTREMAHIVTDSGVRVLIAEEELLDCVPLSVADLRARGCTLVVIGTPPAGAHSHQDLIEQRVEPVPAGLSGTDRAAISYTSGTTGLPKGAIYLQQGVHDAMLWTVANAGLRHEDVWYCAAPAPGAPLIFGSAGLVNGMTTVLPGAGFRADEFVAMARAHSVTSGIFVPTHLLSIVEELERTGATLPSLRQLCYGASPASPTLIRSLERVFDCELQQWYSATELGATPAVILRSAEHRRALEKDEQVLRAAGVPQPHLELAIKDADGTDLPDGEIGELWFRTSTAFAGYLGLADETAEVITDGWIRPGDLGRIDDGLVYLADRKKFMIISGGYNVFPNVIENVVAELPGVREVVAVGAPHERWGEAVVAAVVARDGHTVDPDVVVAHCRAHLGAWEVPKLVDVVTGIPRNAAAKPDRAAVRAWYRDEPARLPWKAD